MRSERILTWHEAHRAAGVGLEFESHTHTHPFLDQASDEHLHDEITISRQVLVTRAWPYGRCGPRLGAAAIRAGYAARDSSTTSTGRIAGTWTCRA
jgi:hypothetical protein